MELEGDEGVDSICRTEKDCQLFIQKGGPQFEGLVYEANFFASLRVCEVWHCHKTNLNTLNFVGDKAIVQI